jgi:hypothetical protein
MKKFVVERILPGASNLTPEELQALSESFCNAINNLDKPYHWVESYITGDKIYCIHIAESEEVIRQHARLAKFPVNMIVEVKAIIDPATSKISAQLKKGLAK